MVLHVDQDHARNNGHAQHNGHGEDASVLDWDLTKDVLPAEQPATRMVDYPRLMELGRELLVALGENPDREGLQDTPRRWADWWREFIEYDPGKTETTFSAASTDQIVCVSGMRVFSLCEHHLLPMWCDVSIGYIPDGKVLGLSKFARIAHQFAHQLQIQERLGQQIADEISRITGSADVAVTLKGEHLCMSARGIRTPGMMSSSVMRGAFRSDRDLRMEFMQMIRS
jgi:GTP cyclohydrolase IA